ncbi:MAG TPA: hypothetical protein VM778_03315, partial [Gemmatimonadota bacterium]|nr:hypothetical protein [Gemmatimonadota bacterium]
ALLAESPAGCGAALALFAASIGMDLVEPVPSPQWYYLTEEGLKLLGIGTWLAYFLGVAADAVAPAQRSAQATAASKSASPSGVSSRNVSS